MIGFRPWIERNERKGHKDVVLLYLCWRLVVLFSDCLDLRFVQQSEFIRQSPLKKKQQFLKKRISDSYC